MASVAGPKDPVTATIVLTLAPRTLALCQLALNDLCALTYFPFQWPGKVGIFIPILQTSNLRHKEVYVLAQSHTASVGSWKLDSP